MEQESAIIAQLSHLCNEYITTGNERVNTQVRTQRERPSSDDNLFLESDFTAVGQVYERGRFRYIPGIDRTDLYAIKIMKDDICWAFAADSKSFADLFDPADHYGLYAGKNFSKDEVIGVYCGQKCIPMNNTLDQDSEFIIKINTKLYICSAAIREQILKKKQLTNVHADAMLFFINSTNQKRKWNQEPYSANVEIMISDNQVLFKAIRDIRIGEEFFVNKSAYQ